MFAARCTLVLTRGCISGLVMLGIGAVKCASHMLLTSLQQISRSSFVSLEALLIVLCFSPVKATC